MKITYYRYRDGYLGVTDQSPTGMKGVIFVGRGPLEGKGIESVCEQAYPRNCLERMERIGGAEVPDDWFAAIGLERRPPKAAPPPSQPAPPPNPEAPTLPELSPRPETPPTFPYELRPPRLTTARGKRHPEVDRFVRQWMFVTIIVMVLWWIFTR